MIIGKVVLEHIPYTKNSYIVVKGFIYENSKYRIIIKDGWVTDGASVPRIFWNIASPLSGRYVEAAILHDALYMAEALPRKECDQLFLECMKELKVPFLKRWIMYYAVRSFGWVVWKNHDPIKVKEAKKYIEVRRLK